MSTTTPQTDVRTTPPPTPGTAHPLSDQQQRVHRKPITSYWPQYAAIAPFYLLFAIFGAFPIVFSIWLSLHRWDGMGDMTWVGLQQYQYLVTDKIFWLSVRNTFYIWFLSTLPMIFLAMLLAFLLNSNIRGKGFYRTALFVPNVTSMVAMTIVFLSVFSDTTGIANAAIKQVFGGDGVPWLTQPWQMRIVVALMVLWRWTGYNSLIFLAGMQSINTEVYEAAKIDGASTWDTFLRITVPLLRPVILFVVITSTIGGLSLFTEPQVLFGNSGGPAQAGLTIVLYQYQQAFTQFDFGYGSAIGWGLFVIAAVFAFINWKLVGNNNDNPRRGAK